MTQLQISVSHDFPVEGDDIMVLVFVTGGPKGGSVDVKLRQAGSTVKGAPLPQTKTIELSASGTGIGRFEDVRFAGTGTATLTATAGSTNSQVILRVVKSIDLSRALLANKLKVLGELNEFVTAQVMAHLDDAGFVAGIGDVGDLAAKPGKKGAEDKKAPKKAKGK